MRRKCSAGAGTKGKKRQCATVTLVDFGCTCVCCWMFFSFLGPLAPSAAPSTQRVSFVEYLIRFSARRHVINDRCLSSFHCIVFDICFSFLTNGGLRSTSAWKNLCDGRRWSGARRLRSCSLFRANDNAFHNLKIKSYLSQHFRVKCIGHQVFMLSFGVLRFTFLFRCAGIRVCLNHACMDSAVSTMPSKNHAIYVAPMKRNIQKTRIRHERQQKQQQNDWNYALAGWQARVRGKWCCWSAVFTMRSCDEHPIRIRRRTLLFLLSTGPRTSTMCAKF